MFQSNKFLRESTVHPQPSNPQSYIGSLLSMDADNASAPMIPRDRTEFDTKFLEEIKWHIGKGRKFEV